MVRFTLRLLALAAVAAILLAGAGWLLGYNHPAIVFGWWALLFFLFITLFTGWLGLNALRQSARGFVAAVSSMVMIKLLASAAFVAGYALWMHPESPVFIIPFFVLYVLFTVFEIRQLIGAQKHAGNSTSPPAS